MLLCGSETASIEPLYDSLRVSLENGESKAKVWPGGPEVSFPVGDE